MSPTEFIQRLAQQHGSYFSVFPDKKNAVKYIDELFSFLFLPKNNTPQQLEYDFHHLKSSFEQLLSEIVTDDEAITDISNAFFAALPGIYSHLLQDAEALTNFDPAAISLAEVLVAYPGFYAIAIYRLAHFLYQYKSLSILTRLFTEHAHGKTGIDIHPGAKIGHPFFIDHGTGVVIGETTIIGNNVKIYQGVTLGATYVAKRLANQKRHPTIEDNVIIYAGSTILGGNTVVGKNSTIGGNVWLTHSVPENSIIFHKSTIVSKIKK